MRHGSPVVDGDWEITKRIILCSVYKVEWRWKLNCEYVAPLPDTCPTPRSRRRGEGIKEKLFGEH